MTREQTQQVGYSNRGRDIDKDISDIYDIFKIKTYGEHHKDIQRAQKDLRRDILGYMDIHIS